MIETSIFRSIWMEVEGRGCWMDHSLDWALLLKEEDGEEEEDDDSLYRQVPLMKMILIIDPLRRENAWKGGEWKRKAVRSAEQLEELDGC